MAPVGKVSILYIIDATLHSMHTNIYIAAAASAALERARATLEECERVSAETQHALGVASREFNTEVIILID